MSVVSTRVHEGVLIVTTDSPPVNALSADVRKGLVDAIDVAEADEAVSSVLVRCEGRTFFAGADISEFGSAPADPWLPEVVEKLEGCSKPVVAAIFGTALGGGVEIALGCHYRIAVPTARFGMPEVKLGLIPGASGTQRLPRLVGVAAALELTTKGDQIGAEKALEIGLVDRLTAQGDLDGEALAFAKEVADARPIPRISERGVIADQSEFDRFREVNAKRFRGYEAPESNINAIEAAVTMPFEEGMAFERQEFMKLMFSPQSAAQRHIFFAERKAARIEGVGEDVRPRKIEKVGIVGAGTMGGGIAMNFLSAGIPVTIIDTGREALERGVAVIRRNYEASAAKGRFTMEQVDRAMAALTSGVDFDALADCDLIIEAVFENMDVKKDVFARLDAVAKPGAILATNTSFLDVDEIAESTRRPEDVVGLHFFSPANVMKLLEVVRARKTANDVLVTAMKLAKTIRKVAVVAGVCHGFIGNRMLEKRQTEATKLLLEGATPAQIDKVHVDFGMPMGPFQMADLAGVDIGWHRDPDRIDSITDALCAENRWGQKKSAGFYDYDEARRPSESDRVQQIIADFASRSGKHQRAIDDREIIERTIYPMVNEGARLLEEGKAQRASDIDVVWVFGYGWPPYRGGPMFWADLEGLETILAGLERHAEVFGDDVVISDLLRRKAEKNERFNKA